jgi:hypothetical protein
MKLSTLILAGLMTVSSTAVFAEGGAERSAQYWANFKLSQQQIHGQSKSADRVETASANGDQTVTKQKPNS